MKNRWSRSRPPLSGLIKDYSLVSSLSGVGLRGQWQHCLCGDAQDAPGIWCSATAGEREIGSAPSAIGPMSGNSGPDWALLATWLAT
jgi:hypothetical protein